MHLDIFTNTAYKKAAYGIFAGFLLIKFQSSLEHFHKTIFYSKN